MPRRSPSKPSVYRPRVLVSDFRRSFRFYRDVIGLRPHRPSGEGPDAEFVERGRPVLAIFERKRMARAVGLTAGRYLRAHVGRCAICVAVPDVDERADGLRARGVRLLSEPTDRPEWGLRTIHLRDPDGVVVELFSRPAAAGPLARRR